MCKYADEGWRLLHEHLKEDADRAVRRWQQWNRIQFWFMAIWASINIAAIWYSR